MSWAGEMARHHGTDGRTCAALLAEIDRLHAARDRLLDRCDESDTRSGGMRGRLGTDEIRALLAEGGSDA